MSRQFFTLDVFTGTPLAGNPLAVVLDAEGLDAAAMQRIAREFNLSETVFVLPPDDPAHRARIRIFTPGLELPFAGHPTVGTAVLLATLERRGQPGAIRFGLEERVGPVSCTVRLRPGTAAFATFELPRLPSAGPEPKDDALYARALGLDPAELGFGEHRPTLFGAGVVYTFVPVRDLSVIGRVRIDPGLWTEAFGQDGLGAAYVYTNETEEPQSAYHARMFSPGDGIPEDPATGSAVAALAGVIAHFQRLPDGEHMFRIEQGFEMGRPSRIELTMTTAQGTPERASIGGEAVIISEGRLHA